MLKAFTQFSLLAAIGLACLAATTQPVAIDQLQIKTAAGAMVTPLSLALSQKAAVLLFVATDCPISNGYAPTLAKLAKEFGDKDVAFYLVYSDSDMKAPDAVKHQSTYSLPGTALLDPAHELARAFHATVTPEVVVIGTGGAVRYRGAIDDQYAAIGKKRFAATQHYLSDALHDLIEDKAVRLPQTEPLGCDLQ